MELLKSDFKTMVDLFESAKQEITISVPALLMKLQKRLFNKPKEELN